MTYITTIILLIISLVLLLSIMYVTLKISQKSQVQKITIIINLFLVSWCILAIIEETWRNKTGNINMILVNLIYLSICFLPIFIFVLGLSFAKLKVKFSKKYFLLFVIPILTTIIIWTNDLHHCFFDNYSVYSVDATYGWYYFFHSIYSYGLIFLGIYLLLSYSIKNSGLFSKQSLLMILGISAPLLVNIAYSFNLASLTFNINPIAFSIWSFCTAIAIERFKLFNLIPISLQKVVNCMSDSYFVINNELALIDYNQSFYEKILNKLEIKQSDLILDKMKNEILTISEYNKLKGIIENSILKNEFFSFQLEITKQSKIFNIDITPIDSDKLVVGIIVLFKDISELRQAQNIMVEQERLSSLGQLIGGIAHNLKTPIMSIAGVVEGLTDLIKEYDESIDDPSVNKEDHHEIAKDMQEWVDKVKPYLSYMTEVIDAVKGQAVSMNASTMTSFTAKELITRTQLLMKNELKRRHCTLNLDINVNESTSIAGEISAIIQVIDNMIINAMDAYGDVPGDVDIKVREDNTKVYIDIKDYAGGIPEKVQEKLFKEMITSKGKNGTGLGLYMSFSTIKGKFKGDIHFETEEGKGTTFFIELPKYKGNE